MADKFNEKYHAGDTYGEDEKAEDGTGYSLDEPAELVAGIIKELAGVGTQVTPVEVAKVLKSMKQKPIDDRSGATEILINILTALSPKSKIRKMLTNKLIDSLWDSLQHPPLTYMGGSVKYEVVKPKDAPNGAASSQAAASPSDTIQFTVPGTDITLQEKIPTDDGLFQYRMPDGSFNSILHPNLGKAGTPYARSVRTLKRCHGVKPDPGLLFDLLMARDDEHFQENPAGISAMFYYHATIIIHDVFRTNRTDPNKSDTSSYLDLAPLYGSSLKEQLEVRTMEHGKLKPDTFAEKRLIGQPPGASIMLVLYNRFHNHVADVLLKINEGGRFSLNLKKDATPEDIAKAKAKQDHDLFNVARLVVGGLYINISLHDYLRAITNTHSSRSSWTLDPRVDIEAQKYDDQGTPRGVGNQVSVEFNLLYRFHSMISKRDERWTNDFFLQLFPDRKLEDLENVSWEDLHKALMAYEKKIPKEPWNRVFGGLKRQDDGFFKDEDLVATLKDSMEDPAGIFGARTTPKILRAVEILGIHQARKWQVASLNEFRAFFGLKRHETFKDINSDDEIAGILEKLYTDPDMVELYPGLMIENFKPVRKTGCGISPTYTLGRAVLSDAVTLVRSDRFNTLDYTVANLTAWGYNEVQYENKTLGGSMLYKLIQRGLPGWFPFNSVAVMQPMYTKQGNVKIAKELGTIELFTTEDPRPPVKVVPINTFKGVEEAAQDKVFVASYLPAFATMGFANDKKKDLSWFSASNVAKVVAGVPNVASAVRELVKKEGARVLEKEGFKLKEGLYQLDLLRDLVIPLTARLLADLHYLDLRTEENPDGTLAHTEVYRALQDIHVWGAYGLADDYAEAWNRRRRAQEGVEVLQKSTESQVQEIATKNGMFGFASGLFSPDKIGKGSLRECGIKVVEGLSAHSGSSKEKVVDSLWISAALRLGGLVTTVYEVLNFFLQPENSKLWADVQNKAAGQEVSAYVAEAKRVTSSARTIKIAKQAGKIDGKEVKEGDFVVLKTGEAARADATTFDLSRATTAGQDNDIATVYVTEVVKLVAGLKRLRPAPGQMGLVKTIELHDKKYYLNDNWSYLSFDPSTWKVHYDGYGKGVYEA